MVWSAVDPAVAWLPCVQVLVRELALTPWEYRS
jgi:hypothetical protein